MSALPQRVSSLHGNLDQCSFALHRICSLGARRRVVFGGCLDWFELLIRPGMALADQSPSAFIRGLYQQYRPCQADVLILERAVNWLKGCRRPTRLSVNVHPQSLLEDSFVLAAAQLWSELRDQGHSLCLELVEFADCQDRSRLETNLAALRAQGILVALDDFGSGFACFDLCAAGVVDVIKIDATLVRRFNQCSKRQAVVNSILALGGGIGAQIVAEGVEHADEARLLRTVGVGFAQGFYFHHPERSGV
ncbi:MAG: EAL domain-containing protein [Wenzhouxiangella sp.]